MPSQLYVSFYHTEASLAEESLRSVRLGEQSLSVKLSDLEETERRVNEELEELELVSWQDKLDMETARCAQLETDTEAVTSSIAWCDAKTGQWQQQLREITAKIQTMEISSHEMDAEKTRLKEQVVFIHLSFSCHKLVGFFPKWKMCLCVLCLAAFDNFY